MTFLENVKTTMKFNFPSHIKIHAKSKTSFDILMGMVRILSSKSTNFKWLSVAYMTLLYITTL